MFLPGEFHGQRNLVVYSPWGHKESDTTEQAIHTYTGICIKHTHSPVGSCSVPRTLSLQSSKLSADTPLFQLIWPKNLESFLLPVSLSQPTSNLSQTLCWFSLQNIPNPTHVQATMAVADFIFLGSKITADGYCSHEIKRCLFFGRKVMTNLDSILKSRDITLPTKVCLVRAMVFPLVTHRCASWTVKKAEYRRIDAFKLWHWRRLLRVPWTARRSNQSILKEISPGCSLEGLILKLKLQYFGHLMRRADSFERPSCWERLRAGGEGDDRGWDGWMASPTQWTWVWVDSGSWCWQGGLACCGSWGRKELDTTERQNWTEQLSNRSLFLLSPFYDLFSTSWPESHC